MRSHTLVLDLAPVDRNQLIDNVATGKAAPRRPPSLYTSTSLIEQIDRKHHILTALTMHGEPPFSLQHTEPFLPRVLGPHLDHGLSPREVQLAFSTSQWVAELF